MSGGFFGFDAALPERRDANPRPGFTGFQPASAHDTFGLNNAGAEEDLAVYQWGDVGGSLLEGGDEMNDETFGDGGAVGEYSKSTRESRGRRSTTRADHFV